VILALDVAAWALTRQLEFTTADVEREFLYGQSSARNLIAELERAGLIERTYKATGGKGVQDRSRYKSRFKKR